MSVHDECKTNCGATDCQAIDRPRRVIVKNRDETIDSLRGSLQNCVNLLERAKRRSFSGAYNDAIEQANRTLYETLGQ